jgi:hypothetical protein
MGCNCGARYRNTVRGETSNNGRGFVLNPPVTPPEDPETPPDPEGSPEDPEEITPPGDGEVIPP